MVELQIDIANEGPWSVRTDHSRYESYLLSVWLADNGGHPVWRFALESPSDGQRRVFDQLDDIITFVKEQMLRDEHSRDTGSGKHNSEMDL